MKVRPDALVKEKMYSYERLQKLDKTSSHAILIYMKDMGDFFKMICPKHINQQQTFLTVILHTIRSWNKEVAM